MGKKRESFRVTNPSALPVSVLFPEKYYDALDDAEWSAMYHEDDDDEELRNVQPG